MFCKTCGGYAGVLMHECKACEKKRMDEWVKKHTFIHGEKVVLTAQEEFYGRRKGTVIAKGERVEGAWGYYSVSIEYTVRLEDGTEAVIPAEDIEKADLKN